MKPVFYFICDNNVQWFTFIIEVDNDKVFKMTQVPSDMSADLIKNITSRELHFKSREFYSQIYCGWSISKSEYDKLTELINLFPSYQKYLKLCYGN